MQQGPPENSENAVERTGPDLVIRPLTPDLMDDLGRALRGSWGATCWCLYPRLPDAEYHKLPGTGPIGQRRRAAMEDVARVRAPGLLAFEGETPVGWIAVAPRSDFSRIDQSRATPRFDDEDVWVIPCITVAKAHRGRGIALALVRAAVAFAGANGAPAVEVYPRAGDARTGDDNAYFGTEPLFRRAGFQVTREPLPNLPRNWVPRVTMRISTRV